MKRSSILDFVKVAGWTCTQCRFGIKTVLLSLKQGNESRAEGGSSAAAEENQAGSSLGPDTGGTSGRNLPTTQPGSQTYAEIVKADVVSVVIGTLRDADKRKQNIIISGLPESQTDDIASVY